MDIQLKSVKKTCYAKPACFQNWFDTSKIMDGGYIKQSVGADKGLFPFL